MFGSDINGKKKQIGSVDVRVRCSIFTLSKIMNANGQDEDAMSKRSRVESTKMIRQSMTTKVYVSSAMRPIQVSVYICAYWAGQATVSTKTHTQANFSPNCYFRFMLEMIPAEPPTTSSWQRGDAQVELLVLSEPSTWRDVLFSIFRSSMLLLGLILVAPCTAI